MMKLEIDFGEIRHVKLEVKSIKQENFEILGGKYELKKCSSTEVEADGEVNIIDCHIMDVVVCPQCVGEYELKFTYRIADETLIDIVRLKVM